MSKVFYTNIDLKGNQLMNVVLDNVAEFPSNPKRGQLVYLTGSVEGYAANAVYQYNGSDWQLVGGSVENLAYDASKAVIGAVTAAGVTTLQTVNAGGLKPNFVSSNLTTAVSANDTLVTGLHRIDAEFGLVKNGYVKKGTIANGEILVGQGTDTATSSGKTVATSITASSDDSTLPTSKAVVDYVGSLAGGITYKGTIGQNAGDTVSSLPTSGVKVGDAYAVTTAGTYAPLTDPSAVGDLIICNGVSGSNISWTDVPVNFTVEDKQAALTLGDTSLTTIATIDGKDITLKVNGLAYSESGSGNVVTSVGASGGTVTVTKGTAVTTVSGTANNGVVTNIQQNGATVTVTSKNLEVSPLSDKHYVSNVSQASDGQVTVSGGTFDSSIPQTGASTTNAPTTSAVKTYVDGLVEGLDGTAGIATNNGGVVTLKSGLQEVNGIVSNNNGDDITLQKVATTGAAKDITNEAVVASDGETVIYPAGNMQNTLQSIARDLSSAMAGSVTSFGGETGAITVGKGLQMTGKQVSTKVSGYIVNNAGTGTDALDLDSTKVDTAGTSTTDSHIATVKTVTEHINALDVNNITGMGAGKTVATLTETDGKIAATFQDISITHAQVSDWDSNVGVTNVAEGTTNGTISVTKNGGSATDVAVHGLGTAAYKNEEYFERAFTDGSHDVVTIGDYTPSGSETATKKIEFFDGTQTSGALGTASNASDTLFLSKAVTAENPIITKDDLSGITGAMVYKGVVDGTHALPTANIQAGWTYVVAAAGTYAGEACEAGDMIIAKNTKASGVTDADWNVINGENQVENKGATITVGAATATDIAVVDGTTITAKVNVTAGSATIASKSGNTVTIKAGVAQGANTGTISNSTGSDITLADVASTGAANELTVTSGNYGGTEATTNAQTALNNLAAAITDSSITIDGHKGAITTGDGITAVAADGGSFALDLDTTNAHGLYLSGSTDGSKQLAMHIASGSDFGTVKVTAGNGLTITSGVVAYAHNTTAITVASNSNGVVTINGTLTPDASDAITASNAITLAKVATTGTAADVAVADTGGHFNVDTVEGALQELAETVKNGVKMWDVSSPARSASQAWVINIAAPSGFDALTDATVSVRVTQTGEEIECDKVLTGTTVSLTFSEAITVNQFTAVVTTKNTATNVA